MAMTVKMIRFAQEWVVSGNATDAAKKAGYSEETAYSIGAENLKKPEIQKYIKQLNADSLKAAKVTRERVVNELAKLAFSSVKPLYGEDNSLKNIKDIPADTAAAIVSVDVDEIFEFVDGQRISVGYTKKVKMASKQSALDSLARMGGWIAPEKKLNQTLDKDGNPVDPATPEINVTLKLT